MVNLKNVVVLLFVVIFYFSVGTRSVSNPTGAPVARTGAPKQGGLTELNCVSGGCHSGTVNVGTNDLNLTIANNPQVLVANQTYSMTVKYSSNGGGHGFQITALDSLLNGTGTFIAGSGNKVNSSGGRSYVTHTNNASTSWTLSWKAPTPVPSKVSFYFVGANRGSGTSRTFTASKTFNNVITAISDLKTEEAAKLSLYPFNVDRELTISTGNTSDLILDWAILDPMGRTILKADKIKFDETEIIQMPSGLSVGMYHVLIQTPSGRHLKRFFKN